MSAFGNHIFAALADTPPVMNDLHAQAIEDLIDDVAAAFFAPGRPPHSEPYQAGFRAALVLMAFGRRPHCDHDDGTCEADAWFAGFAQGVQSWQVQSTEILARGLDG